MTSPRSGFRRAAVASWALAGLGIAGVAGASELAYADTTPVAEDPASEAVMLPEPAVATTQAIPVVAPPPPAAPAPAGPEPAPVAPAPVVEVPTPVYTAPPAPAPQYKPAPQYTAPAYTAPPVPVYTPPPAPVYTPPPAPVQQVPMPAALAPSQGGFPIRHSNTPGSGGGVSSGNKFAPSHTASHGS
jgi:hypothetical protein